MTRILSVFKFLKRVGFAVLLLGVANAQPPAQQWSRVLGSPRNDDYPMTAVAQNGDILVSHGGSASGDPAGDTYLHRLSNSGDTLWTRQIGDFGFDQIPKLAATNDNGCIVALWNESFSGDTCYPVWILKFDQWGDTLWTGCLAPISTHGRPPYVRPQRVSMSSLSNGMSRILLRLSVSACFG